MDHIYVVDREGRYRHVSAGGARVLGFEPHQLTGKHWRELGLPAEVMGRFDAQRDRVLRSGVPSAEEVAFRTPQGEDRYFEYVVAPIAGPGGHAEAVVVVSRDVSERRQAEEQLRRSERELADFFDNATVGLHWVGPDGTILRANQAELDLLGYSKEEYVGRHIAEFHADEEMICDILKRLQAGQKLTEYPARLRCKGGSIKDVLIDSSVLWRDGEFVHTRCFTRDVTERKLADAKLREQEQRTRTILESITDAFCAFDRDWRFLYVNREAEALLGRSRDDLIGKSHWEEYPDTLGTDVERHYRRAVAEGVTATFEFFYPAHDRWYEIHAYPSPEGLSVYFRDVGDRKRVEIALRESEEKFRLMADTIPQLAWMARPDGHIFWYNRRWYEYTGTTPEQMEGWGWQSVHDPEVLPKVLERWKASISTGEPFDMVFPIRGADGRFRPFLTRVNPLRGEAGRILYWFGTNTDIGEQKRAEADARFLADAGATLAGLVDFESTLQKVARLAVPHFADWCTVDMLGEGDALRRVAVAHVDPAKVELAHDLHRRYPPDPSAPQGVWHIVRTGKSEIIPEITDDLLAATVKDAERLRIVRELGLRSYMGVPLSVRGKVLGVVTFIAAESGRRYDAAALALAEDLAHRAAVAIENARLYQEVREADRKKDQFLAILGHELRNPLAPISNALQVLKMPGANGQVVEQAREMMERQVQHMVRLVDDLLDVSRIVRGNVELRREPVELATVVARAVETSQPLIEADGHELTVALPDEPLRVSGDLVRLAQVVGNLLNNAARYTERGGKIRVEGERLGDKAVLRVRDTGIGIAADVLPKIWEMFVQADRRMRGSHGGMGIGLALVRGLVELHGGTVEARSDGPGKGSEFTVTLPLMSPTKTVGRRDQGQGRSPQAASRRVLIVDDNVDAAESLALLLRLGGHEVRVAHDGPSALKLAEAEPPEVAFLDIGMPVMDGYELASRFRESPALQNVLLVALTGWGQEEDRRRTKEAGFEAHEVKPVSPEALDKLLSHPKLARR